MKALLVAALLASGALFVAALGMGCASGADGLRQGCADANAALTSGYQLELGEMQKAEKAGTAKSLLGCFEAFTASLDVAQRAKEEVCKDPDHAPDFKAYTSKAIAIAPAVADAVKQWWSCNATAIGGK